MDARNESTYGRNLIIRLVMLVAISVLSYANPTAAVMGQGCKITTPIPGMTCAKCDNDGDGCWGGACCSRV